MFVNVYRSKVLINKIRNSRINGKHGKVANCNHCSGAFRNSGDITACIMCSRELGHICGSCIHVSSETVVKNKKSA